MKRAIWAANQLRSKPYRYGGGHKSFKDHGYDCSGTISYVLAAAGLINTPMSSTEFRSYGESGRGEWITIYAREGHTFAVIAGLRLDTPPFDHYNGKWAPHWTRLTGHRVALTPGIRSGCSHIETKRCEDASHPSAPRAKCMQDADFLSRKLWEAHAPSLRFDPEDVTA